MNDCYCKARKDATKIVHKQRYSTRMNGFMSITQVVIDLFLSQPRKDVLLKKIGLILDENITCTFDKNSPHRIHVHTKI